MEKITLPKHKRLDLFHDQKSAERISLCYLYIDLFTQKERRPDTPRDSEIETGRATRIICIKSFHFKTLKKTVLYDSSFRIIIGPGLLRVRRRRPRPAPGANASAAAARPVRGRPGNAENLGRRRVVLATP